MLKALLSFWLSIPLAIVLGLAPGVWLCDRWEGGAFDAWSYTVPISLWRPTLRLPPSRASIDAAKEAADLAALKAQLSQCSGDNAALGRAISIQNAAIAANATRGAAALHTAEAAVQQAHAFAAANAGRYRLIAAPIQGANDGNTVCARVEAFDKTFTGAIQ